MSFDPAEEHMSGAKIPGDGGGRADLTDDFAICVQGVGKCYQIFRQPADRLKQSILPRLQRVCGLAPAIYYQEFNALQDVSFQVAPGEMVGIVGRNGSGKSTLLQMIAGTLNPTAGNIQVRGRIAALLELGAGFNPEFTGRENVFLNAAILGFGHAQTEEIFDEIAAFADIGEFLERPVKTYSSGMYVRLAFAVSVCLKPDILIVDEALSVGDAAFQFKCLKRIERMQHDGVTLLFVSHDMAMVQSFCQRAIYLEDGKIKGMGNPEAIVSQYFFDSREKHRQALGLQRPILAQQKLGNAPMAAAFGTGEGEICRAVFAESQTQQTQLRLGEAITLEVDIHCPAEEDDLALAVVVQNQRLIEITGKRFMLSKTAATERRFRFQMENRLTLGDFFITLRLVRRINPQDFLPLQSQIAALHFQIIDASHRLDFLGACRSDIELTEQQPGGTPPRVDQQPDFRIVALLAVRNEARYMERCLGHLAEQGVLVYVIDNDSTDQTVEIARSWEGRGVIGIERYPYPGYFDWQGLLVRKAELAATLEADWFIHHDADEIRQSRQPGETLAQAIQRLDSEGYNAIDFDEFVFLPGAGEDLTDGGDYVERLRLAYYFAPTPEHRVNAWKKSDGAELARTGGHRVEFPGIRLAPEKLVLRHYPFFSLHHLEEKYCQARRYSEHEVKGGWHGRRANFVLAEAWLPAPEELVDPERDGWDTSRPWQQHPFLGGERP